MSENPYQPVNAQIVDIIDESPTIKSAAIFGVSLSPRAKLTAPALR